jgi:hypothetical protein
MFGYDGVWVSILLAFSVIQSDSSSCFWNILQGYFFGCRKQQGVWSQLGKPYECLGIPDDVRFSNLQHPRSEEPPKDKGNHGSRAHNSFQEKQPDHAGSKWVKKNDSGLESIPGTISCIPQSRRRKELLQNYANASSQMSRMLMKMGLVDFHGCALNLL